MNDFTTPTGINWNQGGTVGTVEYGGGDRNMIALFFSKPQHNPAKSTEQGRPWYDDVTFVRIHPPGERLNIVERPATDGDKRRWPQQWAQYAAGKQQIPDGTPVDLLYPDHPSIGAMLRANNVYTVEQLAELSGPAIDQVGMGAQRYVNEAQKYLQAANKGIKASQFRQELEQRDNEIRTLKHTVELLQSQITNLQNMGLAAAGMAGQQLASGQQMRPQYPAGAPKQMVPQFDVQSAQIAATHPTREVANRATKKTSSKRARIQA